MGASLIGAGISAGSSLLGGKKGKKKAAQQQQAALEAQQKAAQQQMQWARDNAIWANEQNKANAETEYQRNLEGANRDLTANRADQSSDFGNLTWTQDPTTGQWSQQIGVSAADKPLLDSLRGKREELVGGLGGGFDVQGDVMNAYRALQNPLLQESRDKENARLAAMGLSTGSGSAWQTAQRSLNDAQTRADQNAILQGFQANQALQDANRQNLGALNSTEGNLRQNLGQADFWKQGGNAGVNAPTMGAAQVQGPNAGTINSTLPEFNIGNVSAPGTPGMNGMGAYEAGQAAGAGTQNAWNQMGQGLGNLGEAAWNAWGPANNSQGGITPGTLGSGTYGITDQFGTPTGGGLGSTSAIEGGLGTGFNLGSGIATGSFQNNPWSW